MERKPIISDRSISSHKPEDKEYLVPVKNHPRLYLRVRTNGNKSWVYRYTSPITKKPKKMTLGAYPALKLAKACKTKQEYDELIVSNQDPITYRDELKRSLADKVVNTFEHFAWLHFDSLTSTRKPNTLVRIKGRITLLCDYIGKDPISEITPPRMLEILIDIQNNSLNAQGKPTDKAERCAGIASDIFNYAGARGFCSSNPASMVKGQLSKYNYGHRPAITKPDEFAKLLRKVETLDCDLSTKNSLHLLALLFVRNGDLRRVKWTDLDLDNARWYLKPLKGQGKENMINEMVVPLPKQAVEIFKEQLAFNAHHEYVFYSPSARKHGIISENTANNRLKDLGYQNIHCVHGYRATAKTMLQEQLKYPLLLVEMALGHIAKDPNGNAYARFEFIDDRAEMMQKWADFLDALQDGKDTSMFKANNSSNDPTQQLKALIELLGKDKVLELLK